MSTTWKLVGVQVDNFRLIKRFKEKAILSSAGSRLVFLGGRNQDTAGANSNMAGKSTLLSAMTWCLYGCDATGQALAANAIRDGEDHCSVSLNFVNRDRDSERIVVYRERDESGRGDRVTTVSVGDPVEKVDGVTVVGTPSEVQPHIDAVFGDRDLFLAVHIFGYDESAVPFARQGDNDKKKLFDLLLCTGDLDAALDEAKRGKAVADSDLQKLEVEEARLSGALEVAKATRDDRAVEFAQELAIEEAAETALVSKSALLDSKFSEADALVADSVSSVGSAEAAVSASERNLAADRAAITAKMRVEQSKIKQLEGIDGGDGTCYVCQSPIDQERISGLLAAPQAALRKLEEEDEALVRDVTAVQDILNDDYKKECSKRDAFHSAMLEISNKRRDVLTRLGDVRGRIARLQEQMKESKAGANRAAELKKELAKVKVRCKRTEAKLKDLTFWVEGFGPRGIRAFRLEQLIPRLNEISMDYSTRLFGDGTHAKYATQTQKKSGGHRERFDLALYDANGTRLEVLSAGQSMRRDIIHMFTMVDFAEIVGCRTVSMLLFDEAFRTLDASGVERVLAILQEKAEDTDLIIVSEHNDELAAGFQDRLTAVRADGETTFVWE